MDSNRPPGVGTILSTLTSLKKVLGAWWRNVKTIQMENNGITKTQYQLVEFYVDKLIIAASTNILPKALIMTRIAISYT
jgi:hypothetical protein